MPELNFTDALPLYRGEGTVARASMTITGTAHSPWLFWDGRADSQWVQALGPLESPVEHGIDRARVAHLVHAVHAHYRAPYQALFGPLPELSDAGRFPESAGPVDDPAARAAWEAMAPDDRLAITRVFVNVGKAIAAFERQIMPGPSRFDAFADALLAGDRERARALFDTDELAGLRPFIGDANCVDCHNGPRFTNDAFHNTGVPARADLPDDHGFERAFKSPTLRNVAEVAPYMHAGQFATLREVLEHYARAPEAPTGHSELEPVKLSRRQLDQLEAFLRSLSGPLAAPEELLLPPPGPSTRSAVAP